MAAERHVVVGATPELVGARWEVLVVGRADGGLPVVGTGLHVVVAEHHEHVGVAHVDVDLVDRHVSEQQPPGLHRENGTAQAAASSSGGAPSRATHSSARARSESGGTRPFAATTPSIRSACTAGHGRPRTTTATVAPPSHRRIERRTPTSRGGLRKLGTTRPSERAVPARVWTDCAKRRVDEGTGSIEPGG